MVIAERTLAVTVSAQNYFFSFLDSHVFLAEWLEKAWKQYICVTMKQLQIRKLTILLTAPKSELKFL